MSRHYILLLALLSGAALADDAAILQCRKLSDTGARLACYDAIAVAPPGARPVAQASAAAPVAAPTASAAAPAASAPVAAVAPPRSAESEFGREQKKPDIDSVESMIPGHFEGWHPNKRIKLANGQVWQIKDDSSDEFTGDNLKVKLVRGMMNTIFMEIDGCNQAPRVRRVD